MSDGVVVVLVQGDEEKRVDYLLRVLKSYIDDHGDHVVEYDEGDYDLDCLFGDISDAIEDGERES